mgnify:CR=1 FL=1
MTLERLHAQMDAPLRSWLGRRAPADVDVDDLSQQVYLRLHKALPRLRELDRVEALVWRTARSVLVDALRKRRPGVELPELAVEEEDTGATRLVAGWLPSFVEALPEPYAEAVRLADLEGVSQAELARRLGLSPSGARSRVQRGREKLRELLLACCTVAFEGGDVTRVEPGCSC